MRNRLAESRVIHAMALAVPFVMVALATGGLRHMFHVYQMTDELYHLPVTVRAASIWPRPLLTGYFAWPGPLVYWVLAGLSRPFGTSLVAVRAAVTVLSWATVVTAYVLLRDRLGAPALVALGFAFVLCFSPFFFGESFLVLTDNPTWLCVVLALERLLAYVQKPALWKLAAFAALAAAASLMRQTNAWLFVPGFIAALTVPSTWRRRGVALAAVALGLVPLVSLFAYWGGFVVPNEMPPPLSPLEFRVRNALMALSVIGLWSAFIVPALEIKGLPARLGRRGRAAVAAAVAVALAALAAHAMRSLGGLGDGDPYGMGIVGHLSQATVWMPTASLSWWLLVPLGAAVVVVYVLRSSSRFDHVLAAALAGLILASAANGTWYQRYVDFPVFLLLVCLAVTAGVEWHRIDRVRLAGLVAVSVFWTALMAAS